jgi:glycosyltransferase involved in cell wall biosynthesis
LKEYILIIGIDASNLRSGGGLVHLIEVLRNADPIRNNFFQIVVWGCRSTLDAICEKKWITKKHDIILESGYIKRLFWQWIYLGKLAKHEKCSILFIPGGSFFTDFRPIVTMSQNMLPFNLGEIKRYGLSLFTFKLLVLRLIQSYSFSKANGVIFLNKYAKDIILPVTKDVNSSTTIVPHGIDDQFFCEPRKQIKINNYSTENPFKLIYISPLEPYKHHDNVVKAVSMLRKKGFPLILDMYGFPSRSFIENRLSKLIKEQDPGSIFLEYHGTINHELIFEKYNRADAAIFASSCENLPITLLESMASGLPIVSSNMLPMSEILGDNGLYFDPLDPISIKNSLQEMIESVEERTKCSNGAYKLSRNYSWVKCANHTFYFLSEVNDKYRNGTI